MNTEARCAAPPVALAYSPSHPRKRFPKARAKCHSDELPSCEPISAGRYLCKDGGSGVVRRARAARAPEGKVLRHVLWYVLRHVLHHVLRHAFYVLVLNVPPKGSVGSGTRVLGVGSAAGRRRVPRRTPSHPRPPRHPARPAPRSAPRPEPRPAPRPSRARPSIAAWIKNK